MFFYYFNHHETNNFNGYYLSNFAVIGNNSKYETCNEQVIFLQFPLTHKLRELTEGTAQSPADLFKYRFSCYSMTVFIFMFV